MSCHDPVEKLLNRYECNRGCSCGYNHRHRHGCKRFVCECWEIKNRWDDRYHHCNCSECRRRRKLESEYRCRKW